MQTIAHIVKSRVTIQDIARQLNSTPATVSRALNNHPRISKSTKQAVWQLADKLHYKRNHLASSLRSGKSSTIGVIIPSAEINFFGSVVHGIEQIANTHGYKVLLYQSNETPEYEQKAIESFVGAKVDGILASLSKKTVEFNHFLDLKNRGIPLVFFDRSNDSLDIPSVVVDDFKGGYLATEHLIQQGYKSIAHISGQLHLEIFSERLKGYKTALKKYGFIFSPAQVFNGDVSIDSGKAAMQYFFAQQQPPDAIFAAEDFMALGVIKAAKEMKIDVPGALGVIGFANEAFGEHITPSLSSFDQQTIQMGKEAFCMLLALIEDDERQSKKKKIVLEPVPKFRESSRKNLPDAAQVGGDLSTLNYAQTT